MSENKIYDLAMQMTNKNVIMQDLNEASNIVQNMFKEKYINKMHNEVMKQLKKAGENPSKELQLLMSMKNFMSPPQQSQMDKLIETLTLFESFGLINNNNNQMAMNNNVSNVYANSHTDYSGSKVRMSEAATASYRPQEEAMGLDPSIHSDGVYDIDSACLSAKKSSKSSFSFKDLAMLMLLGKGGAV